MLERRDFIGALIGTGMLAGREGGGPPPAPLLPHRASEWDLSFLDRLTGKHRQVFDLSNTEVGLVVVKNWYEAYESVFQLKHPQVNAVVGIAARGFPINASDALYEKYPIGELWKVNDPATGAPAKRSIFLDGGTAPPTLGAGVRPLMARGAVFWMCNNALANVAGQIARAVQQPVGPVLEELKAGLNPGVVIVPAHTMLLGLCQERGCAYESI